MTQISFPAIDAGDISDTRDALHAYAGILGALLKQCRKRRKHWWHASLRPSLCGLTTGVIHGKVNFEVELDFLNSRMRLKSEDRLTISEALTGQPAGDLVRVLEAALHGIEAGKPLADQDFDGKCNFPGYSGEQSSRMQRMLAAVAACLQDFRAGIREETSPIQLWPHHFDLSMIWLPGDKVPGVDVADEEKADKQMNFGFTFGDKTIAEPYFYITAYPLPDSLPDIDLSGPATWHSENFNGAVLHYSDLVAESEPAEYLQELWQSMLSAGREQL